MKARTLADEVLEIHPKHPLACMSSLADLSAGNQRYRDLEKCPTAMRRMKTSCAVGQLEDGSRRVAAAEELYELGESRQDVQWLQALARLYLKSGEDKKLFDVLARLADRDADDSADGKSWPNWRRQGFCDG